VAALIVGNIYVFDLFMIPGIGPRFGIGEKGWANIAAIVATAVSILWNFVGYKFIVFKKK